MLRSYLSGITRGSHPRTYQYLRGWYRRYADALLRARQLDAEQRMLPDFLLIGAQKSGTTSLFNYLVEQPDILAPFRKEIHYLAYLYHRRSERWYRAFFPRRPRDGAGAITGEASTYYHMCLHAPERAARLVPQAKLIFLVRDPVERAFSQYKRSVRKGFETRSFEEAIDREFAELPAEVERLASDDRYESELHQHHSYVTRGCYMDQLERWLKWYPRERVLVLRGEDLFSRPQETYAETLAFLGVEQKQPVAFSAHNQFASSKRLNPATRQRLEVFYAPHNQRLAEWMGRDSVWGA